jgi:heptosyltransferase-1
MRVLLVKMSSLGDVVHALPAITDAAAHGVRFDWVVEEAFAAIPRLHPAVDQVLPIGWRRWRGNLPRYHRELNAFRARLRNRRYDLVLDAQGLVKSAAVTAFARGTRKVGFSWSSAREAAATLVYDRRIQVAKGQHAIVRLRRLFAQALGYPAPGLDAELDYGISPERLGLPDGSPERSPEGSPVGVSSAETRFSGAGAGAVGSENGPCVLLHGTTWDSKLWPVAFWRSLAIRAIGDGFSLALPVGSDLELARSRAIAGRASVRVWDRLPLEALIGSLSSARLVIGVDSGLAHLAAALKIPTLVIYGSTSSALTGCRGAVVKNLQAEFPCAPCLSRSCTYRGGAVTWQGQDVVPACYSALPPERVWREAGELLNADRLLHL